MLDYKDNEGGTAYGPTLMGAGLTNRPFVKEMQPIVQLADGKSDREKLRAAQAARSKKYGIQVLADGALSAPSGGPSDEAAFGDPVNYKYPMADKAHASNAHARFAQNSGSYSDAASRNKVYERIVRKELSFGIKPSFDPKNALDSALPSDLKAKLNSKGGSKMDEKDQEIAALKASVETMKAEKTSVETELGSLRTQLADLNKAKELAEKTAQFEKFLSEGKLCPAQKEAFLANDSVKLAELAATVKTEVKGHGGSENPADPVENLDARDAAKEMIKLAEKLQSEGKSPNFREALLRARKENPELLKRLG
jgi:hypothetical protein